MKVRCTAKGRMLGVHIDDSLMVPTEKQMLEDLITAAFNDARDKPDRVSNEADEGNAGRMGSPGF